MSSHYHFGIQYLLLVSHLHRISIELSALKIGCQLIDDSLADTSLICAVKSFVLKNNFTTKFIKEKFKKFSANISLFVKLWSRLTHNIKLTFSDFTPVLLKQKSSLSNVLVIHFIIQLVTLSFGLIHITTLKAGLKRLRILVLPYTINSLEVKLKGSGTRVS